MKYYSSVDSDEREEGQRRSYNEPIWQSSSNRFGVRNGALWCTLGLVVGFSAAIALYSNVGDRVNRIYADILPNMGAVGGRKKEHRLNDGGVHVYTSSKYNGQKQLIPLILTSPWSELESKSKLQGDDEITAAISLNVEEVQQEILGFGGAVTDAAAITYYALPPNERTRLIDAYFGSKGARYSILRVPMNSCDFSVKQYTFDDVPGDCKLDFFDHEVQHDQEMRIPMIKEILKRRSDIKVFVSPWSPPAWMKEPQRDGKDATMNKSAYPLGLLNDTQVHHAWAMYFSAFINAYKSLGIPIWGVTVQNEPLNTGPWEACRYTARAMHLFVKDHLGPVLRRDHPDVVIITYDHNKDCMVDWTSDLVADPDALSYIDGMAFHWYASGADRNLDGSYGWKNIEKASEKLALVDETKFLLSSESCHCPGIDTTLDGAWYRAEKTAHDIMADLSNHASGWVDWNLILDHEGGPNHVGNLCDSPARASMSYKNFSFGPMYYTISHISKFVPPGSKVINSVAVGQYSPKTLGKRPSGVLVGFEATLWPCERSVRQRWLFNINGSLELLDQMTEQFELWKPVCLLGKPNTQTTALELDVCDINTTATKWEPVAIHSNPTEIQLQLKGSSPPVCLGASSKKGGALVELLSCGETNVEDTRWVIGDDSMGALKHSSTEYCLTAGWPFFSSVAFCTPEGETVIVVLNEADEDVPFRVVSEPLNMQFETSIPLKSIQTYVF